MRERPSSFIVWFRMQSLRQDEIGAMVRAVHEDQAIFSLRLYNDVRLYLQSSARHRAALPAFFDAFHEYARYHKRHFDDMPCLVCRESVTALPRQDVDVIWHRQAGLEGGTYGFLDKPCFTRIDQPALDVETLDRFLDPQHGYRQRLSRAWRDALLALWPQQKPRARCNSARPSRLQKSASPVIRAERLDQANALRETRKLASRFAILQRDQFRCRLCGLAASDGEHVRLEVDHIIPRSKGGSNDAANKWVLCFACNRGKGTTLL